jgi:hypothetical protein
LRVCGPVIIVASGHLSPRLAELTEFLLTATALVNPAFCAGGDGFAVSNGQTQEIAKDRRTRAGCSTLIFHEGWWLPLAFVGRVSGPDFMVRV